MPERNIESGCSLLDAGYSLLDAGYWILVTRLLAGCSRRRSLVAGYSLARFK
ncbi:MAG: hypothetical protein JRD05_11205 [Deltaproteobacteria bacterium]|nr:hypothetical protein [Deltaproteobacteria bacterium]